MADPQFSVPSAKARDIAHRLARREKRSVVDVVERALEAYESVHETEKVSREPPSIFYARLSASYGTDLDLEAIIRETRRSHTAPEL